MRGTQREQGFRFRTTSAAERPHEMRTRRFRGSGMGGDEHQAAFEENT